MKVEAKAASTATAPSAAAAPEGGDAAQTQAGAGGEAGAGGDGPTDLTDGWLSGSRLRAVLYAAGEAKLFHTWHVFTDLYFEVGAKVGEVYRKDATCDPYVSPGDPGAPYYLAGKAVPFTSFPLLTSAVEGDG